jgi:CheY-like chemotaxis protein
MSIDATVRFADLADGVVKLSAVVLVAYALIKLLPYLGQRGFTAKIFGNEVKLNGPTDAVETLSATFKKQIDDLRAQVTALQTKTDSAPAAAHGLTSEAQPARTLLWVDDNPDNNLFEVGELMEAGFVVTQVRSTAEALSRLQEGNFDLVVTDMGRKEHGRRVDDAGLRLIEWIREHEISKTRQQMPVFVYCSDRAIATYGEKAIQSGATGITSSTTGLLRGIREAFASREAA